VELAADNLVVGAAVVASLNERSRVMVPEILATGAAVYGLTAEQQLLVAHRVLFGLTADPVIDNDERERARANAESEARSKRGARRG